MAHDIRQLVKTLSSLRAEEAVHHRKCLQLFSLQRKRPSKDTDIEVVHVERKRSMIEENEANSEAFPKLIEFIVESEDKQVTIKQCQEKMREFVNEPYTTKWLKD